MTMLSLRGTAIMLLAVWMQTVVAHTDIETHLAGVNMELKRRPDDYALYLLRGELRRQKQDWPGAEADLIRADQLGSAEVRDQINLYRGRLYQEGGQSRRAIATLSTYINNHPEHVDALRIRALAFAQVDAIDEAIADYTRLITLDSVRSPELWLERARLWVRTGDIDQALASIDDAIAKFGPLVTLIEFGVNTDTDRHNYSAALDRIDDLPLILAESPKWLCRRGTLLEKLNRPDDAAHLYAKALDAILSIPVRRRQTSAIQNLLEELMAK